MNIKGLVLATAVVVSTMASANLLMWQLGDVTDQTTSAAIAYDYATIKAGSSYDTGAALSNKVGDYDGSVVKIGKETFNYASVGADLTGVTAPSFFIELYDAQNNLVGQSDLYSSSDLKAYVVASEFSASFDNANAWGANGGIAFSATAVPEPTSGILLLIGAALVGLKRKRV